MFERSMAMEMYLLEQASDVYKMYAEKLEEEISYGGHASMEGYLMTL